MCPEFLALKKTALYIHDFTCAIFLLVARYRGIFIIFGWFRGMLFSRNVAIFEPIYQIKPNRQELGFLGTTFKYLKHK